MTPKRLIACFDVIGGRVTKAVKFQDNIDVASAEDMADRICAEGIDEIIVFDVTASNEKRSIDIEMVKKVAKRITVPLIVGGGLKTLDDLKAAFDAGADKVSIDSAAVRTPELIAQGAKLFGSQRMVLSTQVMRVPISEKIPSGYEVFIDGARVATGLDGIEWIKRGVELGAGEVCVNSIDNDGGCAGYDMELMRLSAAAVSVPLIASGGAGLPQHLADVFAPGYADAGIISSMLYSPRLEKNFTVREIKEYLAWAGVDAAGM